MPWRPQLCSPHKRIPAVPSQQLRHASRMHVFIAACGVGLNPFAALQETCAAIQRVHAACPALRRCWRSTILTDAAVLEPSYASRNAVILQQLSCECLAGVPPPAVLCAAAGKEEGGRERQAAAPGAAQGHQWGHRSRPAHCPHRRLWSWQGDPAQRGTYLAMALPTLHCCR